MQSETHGKEKERNKAVLKARYLKVKETLERAQRI